MDWVLRQCSSKRYITVVKLDLSVLIWEFCLFYFIITSRLSFILLCACCFLSWWSTHQLFDWSCHQSCIFVYISIFFLNKASKFLCLQDTHRLASKGGANWYTTRKNIVKSVIWPTCIFANRRIHATFWRLALAYSRNTCGVRISFFLPLREKRTHMPWSPINTVRVVPKGREGLAPCANCVSFLSYFQNPTTHTLWPPVKTGSDPRPPVKTGSNPPTFSANQRRSSGSGTNVFDLPCENWRTNTNKYSDATRSWRSRARRTPWARTHS